MSERDDGGPAFPMSEEIGAVDSEGHATKAFVISRGMSLRDYFAAKAMQAILSDLEHQKVGGQMITDQHVLAQGAYRVADAMLKARKS